MMNSRDRGRKVIGQSGDATQRNRPGHEDFRERGALHVLRDNERLGGLGFRIDDVGDEGRAHGVHGARLAFQALARLLRGGHRRVHGFEGDTRATPIFGEPDRPRPARTEPTDQPVAAQFLAFFHALSLPGPSPICGHPRGAAPASSPKMSDTHAVNPSCDPNCTPASERANFTISRARGTIRVRTPWAKTLHGHPTTDRPARTCRWEGKLHGNRYL